MKKISKVLSVVLVMALIVAVAAVSAFAAKPVSISVKTPPKKTVYYEGVDVFNKGWLGCDKSGMVITVTDVEGKTFDVSADDYKYIFMSVDNYVLGENVATITYVNDYDVDLTTTFTITVKENPVASVKITKMPAKTEYDMDKDVLTRENFSFDKLYSMDPKPYDEAMAETGLTYEEVKAAYDDPEHSSTFRDIIFAEHESLLAVDTTGMEIEVTFKDGTKQTITDEQDCVVYEGTEIPVMVDQYKDVAEGTNTLYVEVAEVKADFDVTVKKSAPAEKPAPQNPAPSKKPAATNNKNPEIPNTDGGVSLAAAAVISLVSGCGIALVPSKKKEQF